MPQLGSFCRPAARLQGPSWVWDRLLPREKPRALVRVIVYSPSYKAHEETSFGGPWVRGLEDNLAGFCGGLEGVEAVGILM